MIDNFVRLLEKWGTLAGWITAIVQLPIWLIGVPFFYFKKRKWRKEFNTALQESNYWKEECYRTKDNANAWFQMTKEALNIMKYNTPETYRKFVESYGGEANFQEWWKLPEIPIIENKKMSEE